jgi:Xaa-Pro dipeptidase
MGYKDHFMGSSGAQVSFIGNGIGVEIDEYPFIARGFKDQVLEERMTLPSNPRRSTPDGVLSASKIRSGWKRMASSI